MKICHIAPLVEPLGEQAPGGSEHLVRTLAARQAADGHEVSVIAARGSVLGRDVKVIDLGIEGGRLVPIRTDLDAAAQGEREDLRAVFAAEAEVFGPVKKYLAGRGEEYDIVHNHAYDSYPLFELEELGLPILHTLHLPPLLPWVNERLRHAASEGRHERFVSVSETGRALYERETGLLPRVIYCGLPLEAIAPGYVAEDFFLWVGRVSPEKGLHTAVRCVAEKLGAKLVAIGRVYDEGYYREIEPMLRNPNVRYLGALSNSDVLSWMRRAAALVLPIEWDEPFGLVMVEALASGAPVIASPRGGAREIIRDGENGFFAETDGEFLRALGEVRRLERTSCRASVLSRFSVDGMAAAYAAAYCNVIL